MKIITRSLTTMTFFCAVLVSCTNKKIDNENIVPAEESYQKGRSLMSQGKYSEAAEEFNNIFFQHPGGNLTPQAELMQAYSLYLDSKYEEAIDIIEMFVKLHPRNTDIAYAHYLKSLCYYMQISSVHLDQSRAELAKVSFEELIKDYPGTKYAIDATLKIDLVNEYLAGKEMDVGRYYLRNKDPISAILRFQNVVQNYQTTSHIAEALYRMVESYLSLGIDEEAKKYAAVLGNNYQDSSWYRQGYDLISKAK